MFFCCFLHLPLVSPAALRTSCCSETINILLLPPPPWGRKLFFNISIKDGGSCEWFGRSGHVVLLHRLTAKNKLVGFLLTSCRSLQSLPTPLSLLWMFLDKVNYKTFIQVMFSHVRRLPSPLWLMLPQMLVIDYKLKCTIFGWLYCVLPLPPSTVAWCLASYTDALLLFQTGDVLTTICFKQYIEVPHKDFLSL